MSLGGFAAILHQLIDQRIGATCPTTCYGDSCKRGGRGGYHNVSNRDTTVDSFTAKCNIIEYIFLLCQMEKHNFLTGQCCWRKVEMHSVGYSHGTSENGMQFFLSKKIK